MKETQKKNAFFKLDLLILSVLKKRDCYGYEITTAVREHTEDLFIIKEGVMYPILYRLLQAGYIDSYDTVVNSRNRIYYKLNSRGRQYLKQLIGEFEQGVGIVQKFLEWSDETEPSEFKKA